MILQEKRTAKKDKTKEPPLYNRVMLVDDNHIDNHVNNKMMEYNNFASEVQVFNNPGQALEHLQNIIEEKQYHLLPDVLFLDLYMPIYNGEDFLAEFVRYSKNIAKQNRIVLLSGFILEKHAQKIKSNFPCVVECLHKPLMKNDLMKIKDFIPPNN